MAEADDNGIPLGVFCGAVAVALSDVSVGFQEAV